LPERLSGHSGNVGFLLPSRNASLAPVDYRSTTAPAFLAVVLRALRSPTAPTVWRRLVAVLLAALVLVASAEPLLAEAHDGDAPRADVPTATAPDALVGAVAAGHTDGWTVRSAVLAVVSVEATPAPVRHAPVERLPIHAVHVCHCAHAHGGLLVPEPFVLMTRLCHTARRVNARSDRLPASPSPEPRLRPPLLPHGA